MRPYTKQINMLAVLAFLMCQACSASTSIKSVKAPDYANNTKKLFVSVHGGLGNLITGDAFDATFSSYIQSCGITFQSSHDAHRQLKWNNIPVIMLPPAEQEQTYEKADAVLIHQYAPDTILDVKSTGYTTQTLTRYGVPVSAPTLSDTKYDVILTDAASGKKVWRAQVDLALHRSDSKEAGETLAKDILKKMKQDGLLLSCPAVE